MVDLSLIIIKSRMLLPVEDKHYFKRQNTNKKCTNKNINSVILLDTVKSL